MRLPHPLYCLHLVANDIGEFIWGWPDFEFGVDHTPASYLDVNVDLIVNMPCKCAYYALPAHLQDYSDRLRRLER